MVVVCCSFAWGGEHGQRPQRQDIFLLSLCPRVTPPPPVSSRLVLLICRLEHTSPLVYVNIFLRAANMTFDNLGINETETGNETKQKRILLILDIIN